MTIVEHKIGEENKTLAIHQWSKDMMFESHLKILLSPYRIKLGIRRDYKKPTEITPYAVSVLLQINNLTEQSEISDCNQMERCCSFIHI